MDTLLIEGTEDTPKVILDKSAGEFEISGRSLPEDCTEFYRPILSWLEEYVKSPNDKTELQFKLDYFNTASSKVILDILTVLEDLESSGTEYKAIWYYDEDDEDMEEAGEEYGELVDVPIELKGY